MSLSSAKGAARKRTMPRGSRSPPEPPETTPYMRKSSALFPARGSPRLPEAPAASWTLLRKPAHKEFKYQFLPYVRVWGQQDAPGTLQGLHGAVHAALWAELCCTPLRVLGQMRAKSQFFTMPYSRPSGLIVA